PPPPPSPPPAAPPPSPPPWPPPPPPPLSPSKSSFRYLSNKFIIYPLFVLFEHFGYFFDVVLQFLNDCLNNRLCPGIKGRRIRVFLYMRIYQEEVFDQIMQNSLPRTCVKYLLVIGDFRQCPLLLFGHLLSPCL